MLARRMVESYIVLIGVKSISKVKLNTKIYPLEAKSLKYRILLVDEA